MNLQTKIEDFVLEKKLELEQIRKIKSTCSDDTLRAYYEGEIVQIELCIHRLELYISLWGRN